MKSQHDQLLQVQQQQDHALLLDLQTHFDSFKSSTLPIVDHESIVNRELEKLVLSH